MLTLLIKIGEAHGRYVGFQSSAVAVPMKLFQESLRLIDGLRPKQAPAY